MKNAKIIFTSPKKAEILYSDIPVPSGNQVLVNLQVSTISSGTERANLIGDKNLNFQKAPTEAQYPIQTGYSSAGIIHSVGESVKDLKVGDRVALSWSNHSKYCLIDASNVHKIDDIFHFLKPHYVI